MNLNQVYAPILESEYKTFINEVKAVLALVPSSELIILMSNFNDHVGTDDLNWKGVIRRNGDSHLNPNSSLSIMITYFNFLIFISIPGIWIL